MSTVIEVVIGMSLVFLIAAVGASAINELAEGVLRRRSKYLRVALGRATNTEIVKDLYATKWVRTLMTPMGSLKKAETADSDVELPSYIPSDVFAAAVRELLDNASDWSISALEEFDDTEIAQALASVPDRVRNLLPADLNSMAELRARLQTLAGNEALLSEGQEAIVAAFPPYVFENLDDEARNLQRWYEAIMDRLSGWYKRRTKWWLILWGAFIAVCFNIDSFAITRTLWTDEAVRDAAVATATEYVKDSSTCTVSTDNGEDPFKCVDQVLDQLKDAETLGIPLGWNRWPWQYNASITETIQQPVVDSDGAMIVGKDGDIETKDVTIETLVSDDPRMPADGGEWIMKILGLLGTAVAVSLGAPVWFDILNKFVGFRASGVKPPPGGTSGALDQPAVQTTPGRRSQGQT
jgi:hypothetical protein